MDLKLNGKSAWVVGATGAIGRGIAAALAGEGARPALTSRRGEAVAALADALDKNGAETLQCPGDARDRAAMSAAAGRIAAQWGRIDILVTAMTVPAFGPFLEIGPEAFQDAIGAKLIGSINCLQAALPVMCDQGGGSIVCITGTGGKAPIGIHMPGGSVNAGLNLVLRGLANEFGPAGIRVNAVSPGPVRSPRQDAMQTAGAGNANPAGHIPLRRFGEIDEVADAVLFLASDRASYITGSVLNVDGGGVLTL